MTGRELKRAGVLFLFPATLFFFPFLRGQTFFLGDKTSSFQPWLTYAAQEIQAGRFPLWNPYSACGEPFVGNPQVMLFNPTALLYWLFPFVHADRLFLLLCQGLLFLFTYFLARQWVGHRQHHPSAAHAPAALAALAFAWGGFAVGCWEFPSAIGTLPFLPLFFLLGLGENWTAIALATAMALTTGYVQFVYHAVLLTLAGTTCAAISRRPSTTRSRWFPFVGMAAAVGAGAMLSLVQILPSWENTAHSIRAGMQNADTRTFLLTPVFLIRLFVPWLTNTVALGFQTPPFGPEFWPIQRNWLATLFLGTPVFFLSIVGLLRSELKKAMVLGGIIAAATLLSLGIEPFFSISRTVIPGFRYLTHFSNAIVSALLGLALASTAAAHPRRGRNLLLFSATVMGVATGIGLAMLPSFRIRVLHAFLGLTALTPAQDRWVAEAGGIAATMALCFAGAWLFFRRKRWAVLWCFTLFELWTFGRTFHPLGPKEFFHRPLALAQLVQGSRGRFSISPATMKTQRTMGGHNLVEGYDSVREAFYPNVPLPFRVHQTWAYEVFGVQEFAAFRRRLPDLPGVSAALDFLGASPVMTTLPLPPPNRLLGRSENALLYTRPKPLDRVSVVPSALVLPSAKDRLDYLFSRWDPKQDVVVESEVAPTTGLPVLEDWKDAPGRVDARGRGSGWLVHSGIYFPGWVAFVNGKPAPLLRANHAFQTVATPEASWNVRLIYRPKFFRTGLWLSLLATLCAVAWLGIKTRRLLEGR